MTWNYTYTPIIWPSILTALFLFSLSIYSGRKRSTPGALPFAIGSLLAGLWVAGSVFGYAAANDAIKIFWFKFSSVWQLPATTAITCFVLEYVWPRRCLTRRNLILLSIAPLLDVVMIVTNAFHHLEWHSLAIDGSIILRHGPSGWFALAYSYGLGLLNVIVLGWLFWRSPQHRWPVAIMLTGQVTARTVYLLGVADMLHSNLPLDTLGIGFLFLMYAIVLFGFRIFDPISLAHQAAVEQMHSAMLVLDPQERITSLNPMAERVLNTPASHLRGKSIKELLPAYLDTLLAPPGETEMELSLGAGEALRYYRLSVSPLKDFRGSEIGRLLMLHDVTEQKQAQLKIVEQQRAMAMLVERERLARELHDSLGQVFAFVNTQGQTIHRLLSRGDISIAQTYLDRLVDVAQDADLDIRESILGLRVALFEQGFFPALRQYLARYEKNFGIHAELIKPETMGEGVFEPLAEVQLLRILQEALTNVRKYANADSVRIAFVLHDSCVRVSVQDDGQGFDTRTSSEDGGEHVGLRVMGERAAEIGGSLSLRSEPGQGTLVEVCVPVKGGWIHADV
jgi:signal transduction histidine kinase